MKMLTELSTSVRATERAVSAAARSSESAVGMTPGISLLLLRPHLLIESLHHLCIRLAMQLVDDGRGTEMPANLSFVHSTAGYSIDDIVGELLVSQEVMDKVKGMESKLEYQIKKLVNLASTIQKQSVAEDDITEDPLAFRPNLGAIATTADKAAGEDSGVYRAPRVAAVPYNEGRIERAPRNAPALLSEFAATMGDQPLMETTTGLSIRPVSSAKHSNSTSAKRAAELKRMNEFEEENMTRLVLGKKAQKQREADEEALALGYGVGGPPRSRGRRQNGLEAELEGVLGDRSSKGLWEGVGRNHGSRENAFERGAKKRKLEIKPVKKTKFDKDVARARR